MSGFSHLAKRLASIKGVFFANFATFYKALRASLDFHSLYCLEQELIEVLAE